MPEAPDAALELRAGPWSATLLPRQGAAFAALSRDGRPLLQPLGDRPPTSSRAGAFWMLPWTNRLDGGRFPWAGQVFHFPLNRPDEGNALHGLARDAPWQVLAQDEGSATLAQRRQAAPFDYAAELRVTLDAVAGLHLALTLTNAGSAPCPMGIGWHPWFARPAGTTLHFAAEGQLRRDARGLPVAAEPAAPAAWFGQDRHFTGWDGTARFQTTDHAVVLRAGGAWARNLQLFAPAETPVLCLEPVSHPPDAINRPEFGAMAVLAPGASLEGWIALEAGPPG